MALHIFDALSLVEADGKTDYDLASALDLTLPKVRRGLYLLQDRGLVKRHEHRNGSSSVPSFYTYHANWPRLPPAVSEEEMRGAPQTTDVPGCYLWA